MHILLPPSETKRLGGGSSFAFCALAHHDFLFETRMRVRDALIALCGDADAAVRALKLGVKNRGEFAHNLVLDSSGAMPAIDRYTGVLYDALNSPILSPVARAWVSNNVSVQSALFGLLRANDNIPAYRLSASSILPELGGTLKRTWAETHHALDLRSLGWVLDLRSKDYVALAPLPANAGVWLHVAQRCPTGEVRALNHFNKAAKGSLVRQLAETDAHIGNASDFIEWARSQQLEVFRGEKPGQLTLVTELGSPVSAG